MSSRLEVEDEVDQVNVVLCDLCLTGDFSPPYIGDGLGFWGYKEITWLPYNIIYCNVRFGLDHYVAVEETPDRKYCSQATVA